MWRVCKAMSTVPRATAKLARRALSSWCARARRVILEGNLVRHGARLRLLPGEGRAVNRARTQKEQRSVSSANSFESIPLVDDRNLTMALQCFAPFRRGYNVSVLTTSKRFALAIRTISSTRNNGPSRDRDDWSYHYLYGPFAYE